MQDSALKSIKIALFSLLFIMADNLYAQGGRAALVIGNSDYPLSPLQNPVNDATDIAASLRRLGFNVIHRENATHIEMENAVREFGEVLTRSKGIGIFFYAGHGVQVNGHNFLIPIDADIQDETEVKHKALDVDFVLGKMELADNQVNLLILDACRNNPFERRFRSITSRGLAPMNAPSGTVIWYATRPGKVAMDGRGRNSPFTRYLLDTLQQEGTEARKIISHIAVAMRDEGLRQEPWQEGIWLEDFYFTYKKPMKNEMEMQSKEEREVSEEQMYWTVIKDMNQASVFEDYLNKCGKPNFKCKYKNEAQAKLAMLKQSATVDKPSLSESKPEVTLELEKLFRSDLLVGAKEINLSTSEDAITRLSGNWECKWKATHKKVMSNIVRLTITDVTNRSFKLSQSQASPLCANTLSSKGKLSSKNMTYLLKPQAVLSGACKFSKTYSGKYYELASGSSLLDFNYASGFSSDFGQMQCRKLN